MINIIYLGDSDNLITLENFHESIKEGKMKAYLGDSVYADFDGFSIILTTENVLPDDPNNTIYLKPNVIIALIEYANKIKRKTKDPYQITSKNTPCDCPLCLIKLRKEKEDA